MFIIFLGSHFLGLGGRSEKSGLAFFFESVAFSLDVERGAVVKQPVQDGRGEHLVIKDLPPVYKALV